MKKVEEVNGPGTAVDEEFTAFIIFCNISANLCSG
jgi:hypothetical protein